MPVIITAASLELFIISKVTIKTVIVVFFELPVKCCDTKSKRLPRLGTHSILVTCFTAKMGQIFHLNYYSTGL